MTLFEDLKWRGLIKDITSPELEEKLSVEKRYKEEEGVLNEGKAFTSGSV